jgi:hypothetical protein
MFVHANNRKVQRHHRAVVHRRRLPETCDAHGNLDMEHVARHHRNAMVPSEYLRSLMGARHRARLR